MTLLDRAALALLIIGGLNWGLVSIFRLDVVAALFGGSWTLLSRVIYGLVGLSALWCLTLFFREEGHRSQQAA